MRTKHYEITLNYLNFLANNFLKFLTRHEVSVQNFTFNILDTTMVLISRITTFLL